MMHDGYSYWDGDSDDYEDMLTQILFLWLLVLLLLLSCWQGRECDGFDFPIRCYAFHLCIQNEIVIILVGTWRILSNKMVLKLPFVSKNRTVVDFLGIRYLIKCSLLPLQFQLWSLKFPHQLYFLNVENMPCFRKPILNHEQVNIAFPQN